jgi:pimeloyl-ACP methyl ester carboxylesterase
MSVVVVYVHGLWLSGYEGILLRRRLSKALDAETRSFTYSSVRGTVTDNALALHGYLAKIRADTVHLVAHSLGGLVVLKLFELAEGVGEPPLGGATESAPGRIVLLGSPVQGSRTAARLMRLPFGNKLMGQAGEVLLGTRERCWNGVRDLGVIAGALPIGAGRLLGPLSAPNDGTVLVEETSLPGAADQLTLRVSHSGLPYAASVARQTTAFLRRGRFQR